MKKNLAKGTLKVLLCHSAAPTRRPAASKTGVSSWQFFFQKSAPQCISYRNSL
jgi:hypothetical protein